MQNLNEFTEVAAVKPIAPYIGGKRQLSRTLCEMIAETPHSLYTEAFVGMGG
ncbi:DNA adenine methylase, partial [Ochrobactrum sp. SFR4]|nr:DNA adenine methylase [Ochrobactrum sp. SFR4]